jgi:hypothetical protein
MKGPTPGQHQKISDLLREEAMKTPDLKRRRRLLNLSKTGEGIAREKARRYQ